MIGVAQSPLMVAVGLTVVGLVVGLMIIDFVGA